MLSKPNKDEIQARFNNLINKDKGDPTPESGEKKPDLFAKFANKNRIQEVTKIIDYSIASNPSTAVHKTDRILMTDPCRPPQTLEQPDYPHNNNAEDVNPTGDNQKFSTAQDQKYITTYNQNQASCLETSSMVKLLDADEFEEVVRDKSLMQGVSGKLREVERLLDSDSQRLNGLFSDLFELDTEVSANKFIEEHTVQTVDVTDKDAFRLQEQRIDLRPVTAISTVNDQIVCSYGEILDENVNKNDFEAGVVQVWDANINNKPKCRLSASSPVTCSMVDPSDPNIVFGGLQNGQIVKWDLREKKLPVQITKVTEGKHQYIINSLNVSKFSTGTVLVSSSFEGRVCQWSLKDLRFIQSPENTHEFHNMSAFALPRHEMVCYSMANIQGNVTTCDWQSIPNTTSSNKVLKEHLGTITSIDYHQPLANDPGNEFGQTLLSGGIDSSIKVWNHKWSDKPLLNIDCSDEFIGDVKWSPHNANMFVCGDAKGMVYFQNFEHSLEQPQQQDKITHNQPITKMAWMNMRERDNSYLAVGDFYGKVQVCKLKKMDADDSGLQEDKFKTSMKYLKEELFLLKEFNN